jgi:hypothetical protein
VAWDVTASYVPDPLPIGRPAQWNLHWKNSGTYPAYDATSAGKIYLREHSDNLTQEEVIGLFKKEFEDAENSVLNKELPTLLPNMPSNFWYTATGPVLTQDDKAKIYEGRLVMILVAAMRFRDGAGLHESHVCNWMQAPETLLIDKDGNPIFQVAWHSCIDYVSQVDRQH